MEHETLRIPHSDIDSVLFWNNLTFGNINIMISNAEQGH